MTSSFPSQTATLNIVSPDLVTGAVMGEYRYVHMYVHEYLCACMCVCVFVPAQVCECTCMCVHTNYVHMQAFVHACVCVHVCVCLYRRSLCKSINTILQKFYGILYRCCLATNSSHEKLVMEQSVSVATEYKKVMLST